MASHSIVIAQVVVAVLLSVAILLQNRGSGLGSAFGGEMGGYYAKRGIEKFLFRSAVALGAVFLVLGALNLWFFQG